MVKLTNKFLLILILVCQCFYFGCSIDLPGLFASHNLDERFAARNTFKFLSPDDMTLTTLGDSYSFLVVSDTHIENGDAFGLEKIKGVIEADSKIKFVVVNGDITQCAWEKDFKKFNEIADSIRGLGVPVYPTIGNHDIYQNNWGNWKKYIGSSTYRINGDSATLLILDTANAYFGKAQLDWLEEELKNTSERVFVFTHANIFSESPNDIQQLTDSRERARLLSILNGRCDVMFSGHLHKRIDTVAGGVQFRALEDFVVNKAYCIVTVSSSGISYKYRKM